MAFTEAMDPNVNGSSTMGIKKSVVLITHEPSPRSNTAASSRDSFPTSKAGKKDFLNSEWRMVSKTAGEILQPQPAPWLYCVSFTCSMPVNLSTYSLFQIKMTPWQKEKSKVST